MSIRFDRTFKIDQRASRDAADGVVEMAISSEAPYERWFGIEILSHDADAIDLTRLAGNAHPLLLNHDTCDQIGVLLDPAIGADKMLRCSAKFSRAAAAQEILADVRDGIRQLVSVGYFVDEIVELEPTPDNELADWIGTSGRGYTFKRTLTGEAFESEMRAKHGEAFTRAGLAAERGADAEPSTYLVTRWTPFEASIVPVPADVTVGIGRSAGVETTPAIVVEKIAARTPIITVEKKMTVETKTPAELEIERRDGIQGLAESYAKWLKPADGPEAVRSGKSADQFKDLIIERMQSRHTDTSAIQIGLTPKEIKKYSFGKALQASVTGNWADAGFERECSEAVGKIMGRTPEGFFLPPDVFRRDFNVGTSSEAGNLVPTYLRDDLYVDALRNNLVMGQLGARILAGLTGNVDMPRKSTVSTIGSATEIGSASETNPTTAKVTLTPKRMTAFVEVSKQAILQSAMSLENMIRDDLVTGVAVNIENQIINGTATAPQMTGIRYTTGIGTVAAGANAATLAWSHIVDLESACANANAEPDRLAGYLLNTKVRGKAKQVQKGTNLPFLWDNGAQPLNGYRAAVSNNVPSNLTKGTSTTICSASFFGSDWSMATIGLFGGPDVTVDPYTKADTGQVKITINQFADFGIRQPACFAKIEDLLTT
jgi:HK97 family phage major capsid protein